MSPLEIAIEALEKIADDPIDPMTIAVKALMEIRREQALFGGEEAVTKMPLDKHGSV